MKRNLTILLGLVIACALPANSFAFYLLGEINEYLSYDRFNVKCASSSYYYSYPQLEGRLINETNEQIHVVVHIFFCDIFKARHNQVMLSLSMKPKEKVEFHTPLRHSEFERAKDAHHLEFQIDSLIVGGKQMGKQYVVKG